MYGCFVSPKTLTIANELLDWTKTYLSIPHPKVNRPHGSQEVCPFVSPALENDSLFMVFHNEVNGNSIEPISQIMLNYIPVFRDMSPFDPASKLRKALLVVFPEISEQKGFALDLAHANIKTSFIASGLMVGQFHKRCDERAVYNRSFRICVSPYPLMAIRYMALHDIVFIQDDDEEWFHHYNSRFGERFKSENLDDYTRPLVEYYLRAKERYVR